MADTPIEIFCKTPIVNVSMSSTITSNSVPIREVNVLGVQFIWTGSSPVGYTQLEFSNDNVNFTPDNETFQNVSGNTGSNGVNYWNIGFQWVRLSYVYTSGSGTLNATINGKRV